MNLVLRVMIEEPTTIRVNSIGGNLIDTADHIPGHILRAALANRYLWLNGGVVDDDFLQLFEGGLIVRAALPATANGRAMPAPQWWLNCKTNPKHPLVHRFAGLTDDDLFVLTSEWMDTKDGNPATLADAIRSTVASRRPTVPGCQQLENGNLCGGRLKPLTKRVDPLNPKSDPIEMSRSRRGRTATELGRAKDGSLFTQVVLEVGQVFESVVSAPDDLLSLLSNKCALDSDAFLFVGRGRTVGGVLSVQSATVQIEEARTPLPTVFGLQVVTPAILTDQFLRPSGTAHLPNCEQLVPLSFVEFCVVDGFDTVAGLPRAPEIAVSPGSLLMYVNTGPAELDVSRGIGFRTHEGFGEVRVVSIADSVVAS
jgi:hypothetical protein